jgi:hypothetical protein
LTGFDLVAARLEAAKREHIDELNRDIFRVELTYTLRKPLTWRERVGLKASRVRAYFVTLWRALRGDDPYEEWE